jgi:mono/diheme cytochrome c family protein
VSYRLRLGIAALATVAVVTAATYLGSFNVAADEPHWDMTESVFAWIRDRSIAARASAVPVRDLADPELISEGAEHYVAMCAGCHLAPGMAETELRAGLYPKPPELTAPSDRDPRETFWIIKHGIKMSGMPAWGTTHDDDGIWGLVAFVRQLPTLEPAAYQRMAGNHGEPGHEHGSGTHGEDAPTTTSGCTMTPVEPTDHEHDHADDAAHEH